MLIINIFFALSSEKKITVKIITSTIGAKVLCSAVKSMIIKQKVVKLVKRFVRKDLKTLVLVISLQNIKNWRDKANWK